MRNIVKIIVGLFIIGTALWGYHYAPSYITLQKGETISYKWLNETDFISFINSKEMIDRQKKRYLNYFNEKGYLYP